MNKLHRNLVLLMAATVVLTLMILRLFRSDAPAAAIPGPPQVPALAANPTRPEPAEARPLLMPQPTEETKNSPPTLDDIWDEALSVPTDRVLILAEFERRGGKLVEAKLDQDIESIIRGHFGGDRRAFERDLAGKGYTFEEFQKQRRETLVISMMKAMVVQRIQDPEAKERAIEDWLAELRAKGR